MGEETVPGMAEAIERRRRELGLSPGEFAERAGITRQGAGNVRRGVRRQYHDKVKLGVARALGWRADAIDRLLIGEQPVELDEPNPPEPGIELIRRELEELRAEVSRLNARVEERHRPGPGTR
jgi:transcriptional regulator with XRE-family HTH domain